jgi:hypothetical protein
VQLLLSLLELDREISHSFLVVVLQLGLARENSEENQREEGTQFLSRQKKPNCKKKKKKVIRITKMTHIKSSHHSLTFCFSTTLSSLLTSFFLARSLSLSSGDKPLVELVDVGCGGDGLEPLRCQ